MKAKLAILLPLLAISAGAAKEQCKGSKQVVAPCYRVHGRMSWANGFPNIRIWIIGTHRILGVRRNEAGLPDSVVKLLYAQGVEDEFDNTVYGNFEVCPLEKRIEGHMQDVCVESADKVKLVQDKD
jgi:hypothetical protein